MLDNSLFLSGLDKYHTRPFWGKNLRAYIMMHSLFNDSLVVTDSLINNNKFLRNLIWPEEPGAYGVCPRDLANLLQDGFLIPALRNTTKSLKNLREDHVNRNVDGIPSIEYVDFVEEHLLKNQIQYEPEKVSNLFKQRCLNAFCSNTNQIKSKLSKKIRQRVYDWIECQEPLLYTPMRIWMKKELEIGRASCRERVCAYV
jgi:hypothetical protein